MDYVHIYGRCSTAHNTTHERTRPSPHPFDCATHISSDREYSPFVSYWRITTLVHPSLALIQRAADRGRGGP